MNQESRHPFRNWDWHILISKNLGQDYDAFNYQMLTFYNPSLQFIDFYSVTIHSALSSNYASLSFFTLRISGVDCTQWIRWFICGDYCHFASLLCVCIILLSCILVRIDFNEMIFTLYFRTSNTNRITALTNEMYTHIQYEKYTKRKGSNKSFAWI